MSSYIISSNIGCIIIFVLICLSALSLSARVGESKASLEKRLLSGNRGIAYPKSDTLNVVTRMRPIYYHIFKYLPDEASHSLYYKSNKNEKVPTRHIKQGVPANGWLLHVVYIRNRVVLESYRRLGEGINQFDRDTLLVFNNAGSHWKPVGQGEKEHGVLDYNYETENKKVRSLHKGIDFIFYTTGFLSGIQSKFDKVQLGVRKANKDSAQHSTLGF